MQIKVSDTSLVTGSFSSTGNLFVSAGLKEIKIYDTYDPLEWEIKQIIRINEVSERGLVDVHLSDDEKFLVYSC